MRTRISRCFAAVTACVFVSGSASAQAPATPPKAMAAEQAAESDPKAPRAEVVLLGRFQIREVRATEGAKNRTTFALYAEVAPDQATMFRALLGRRKHRIRNEVITAVRGCEQREFQQPGLGHFRRRIYLRLRRTHPELMIKRLLIGEFEFIAEAEN